MPTPLGELLKQKRKDAKVGVEEAGNAIGVSRKQIHRYESGEHDPDIDSISILSKLYKCDLFRDISMLANVSATGPDIKKMEKTIELIAENLAQLRSELQNKTNSDDARKIIRRVSRGQDVSMFDQEIQTPLTSGGKSKVPSRQSEQDNKSEEGK